MAVTQLDDVPEDARPFDYRLLIREVLATHPSADPSELVDECIRLVPDEALRDALRQTTRHYILIGIHEQRGQTTRPDDQRGSARWAQVGQVYKAFLQRRENLGGDNWKWLADCTRDDLLASAAQRMVQAKGMATEARRLELLAAALDKAKVKIVSDLPEDAVIAVARWQPG